MPTGMKIVGNNLVYVTEPALASTPPGMRGAAGAGDARDTSPNILVGGCQWEYLI